MSELTGYPGISGFGEQKIPGAISQVVDSMDSSFLPLCSKAHVKYSLNKTHPVWSLTPQTLSLVGSSHTYVPVRLF